MKYIDAEKLIAEIYKCREDALSVVDIDKANNLIEVIELIEDFQQEQPLTTEKVVEQCKKFGGNPEVIQHKQPEVELEREIRDYFSKWDYDYYNCVITMGNGIVATLSSIQNVARHFWNKGYNARKEE